jgi:polyphosphate kinase
VLVRNPRTGKEHFARVKVPPTFRRFVALGNQRFVPMEDVIREHLRRLFPGMEVLEVHTFRVTRNEDLDVEEDDAENLLTALEKELLRRRFGPPVRLEVEESISTAVLELLVSELGISEAEVFRLQGPLDLTGLHDIADLRPRGAALPRVRPDHPPAAGRGRVGRAGRRVQAAPAHDVLLHHPYDSFATSVQRFIEQAAADPHVLAIKQTLYRTSGDCPIIDALVDAPRRQAGAGDRRDQGRFDEAGQHPLGPQARAGGCHVVYGLVGLKTHCKLAMVVRDEPEGIRRYTHIGTGNYNSKTARLYEDLGLITTDEAIGEDVAHLFNNLSGCSRNASLRRAAGRARLGAHGWSTRSTARSHHHAAAGRGSGSRPTRSSTRPSSTRSTSPRRQACPSSCWCAASARCGPACPGCRRTSRCARSSAGSSSTAGSSGSRTAASRGWIGSADMMHRNLGPPRRGARAACRARRTSPQVSALLDLAFAPTRRVGLRATATGAQRGRTCPQEA